MAQDLGFARNRTTASASISSRLYKLQLNPIEVNIRKLHKDHLFCQTPKSWVCP